MLTVWRRTAIVMVFGAIFCAACRFESKDSVLQDDNSVATTEFFARIDAPALVEREWRLREDVIIAALMGKDFKPYELEHARDFFFQLTGIVIPIERTDSTSWKTAEEARTVFPLLRQWFAQNHSRLFWDKKENRVKMCLLKAERGGLAAGQRDVVSVWRAHESVFIDLGKNPPRGTMLEFQDAVEFFYGLTGIPIRGDGSYAGFGPTSKSIEDFKLVKIMV